MKKKKFLVNFIFLTSFITLLNSIIFKLGSKKYNAKDSPDKIYLWKLGKIAYKVRGEGPPLLLIHGIGNGTSSYEWRKNIPYLSKHFKVYSIDLLGFGYSSRPKLTYTAFLYVQLIQDFIKNVIKEPTFVIANSQSASFAVIAANFSPNLFKKLILISPTGIKEQIDSPTFKSKIIKLFIETPIIGTTFYNLISSKLYIYYFIKTKLYNSSFSIAPSLVDNYYLASKAGGASSRYLLASFLGGYMNINITNFLNKISCPICTIWGKENPLVSKDLLNEWTKINPSITSYIFRKSKTMPHEEEPFYFNEVCKNFFN
ncbi:alpha/beta fold hydrolase [Defluviitalea phaphyphila]|uniref:alpha/beta fold hydrolase n=1 Tax=Defluviitalea phaphyphila TaxID=1473580 RepID=UPI000730F7CA|nr:alpha/beta fold hydrolase [Defluviitalea phaphyphila]